MTENEVAKEIVDAAYKIHQRLGPGLLESVYEVVLAHELQKRGLKVLRQHPISIAYEDFIQFNGEQGAKEAGKWRLEGKDYLVQEGDIMHFRFNV